VTDAKRSQTRRLAVVAGLLLVMSATDHAAAQGPFDGWRQPVVVELELAGGTRGQQLRALGGRRIEMGPGESFTVEVDAFDQRGRRFPRERFQMGVELDRACDGRLSVSDTQSGDLEFRAGRSRGRCSVVLFVPGNLNLDYPLEFEVTGIAETGYTRRQAEEIAERLYRAILQRNLERGSRASAVAEIQRGRIDSLVSSLIDSAEFADVRQRSQPAELLEAFYAGLLERAPDSAGANDYLRDIMRGRHRDAIMNLLRSEEFEFSLPAR
jgi:hypothetical protein